MAYCKGNNEYGYVTYADFEKACNSFMKHLPDAKNYSETEALIKTLGLAFLNYTAETKIESIKALQRYEFLTNKGVRHQANLISNELSQAFSKEQYHVH
jgi:hypothetical protein